LLQLDAEVQRNIIEPFFAFGEDDRLRVTSSTSSSQSSCKSRP
jgi:hypothetical protein